MNFGLTPANPTDEPGAERSKRSQALSLDPRFPSYSRRPGLDLLRALAIAVVVFFHAGTLGFPSPGHVDRYGWVGVDLFFVLSGYLIGGQLLRAQPLRLGRFYGRRALRIMPVYLAVLAFYASMPEWREHPEMTPLWKFLLSVQNLGMRGGTAFSHAWSLAIEDQFYLVLPMVLLFLRRRPGLATALPLVLLAAGILLRGALHFLHPSLREFNLWIYYPTWTRLDPLVLGVALAALELHRPQIWERLLAYSRVLPLLGLILVAAGLALAEGGVGMATCMLQFPLIAFGMAALLVAACGMQRVVPGAALLASLAYSVYLSHKLVIHAVLPLVDPTSLVGHLVMQVLVYLCGALLYFAVERPFLQLRERLT